MQCHGVQCHALLLGHLLLGRELNTSFLRIDVEDAPPTPDPLSRRPKFTPMPRISPRTLQDVAQEVSCETGLSVLEIRAPSKRRALSPAKRRLAALAVQSGVKAQDVAVFLSCSAAAVTKLLQYR